MPLRRRGSIRATTPTAGIPRQPRRLQRAHLLTISAPSWTSFPAASGDGKIHKSHVITADPLNTFMERFFTGSTRVAGNTVNQDNRKSVWQGAMFYTPSLGFATLIKVSFV